MTDRSTEGTAERLALRIVDPHQDRWHALGGEDGPMVSLNPAPDLLLDLAQWHAVRAHWPAGLAVGVRLPNDGDLEALVSDLPRLALIALHFPKFTDGRAYSQARLLRSRHRYAGELRATGDVIPDMAPLLARTGFSSALLRPGESAATAERALGFFAGHYQGDTAEPQPRFGRRASA